MTSKELKKLNRRELLEMLIEEMRENERLTKELEEKNRELEKRDIKLKETGNIAEAALQINKVFEAAQAAAEQYVESVKETDGFVAEQSEKAEPEKIDELSEERVLMAKEKEILLQKEKEMREVYERILAIEEEYKFLKRFYKKYEWLSVLMDKDI